MDYWSAVTFTALVQGNATLQRKLLVCAKSRSHHLTLR
jgi:hypothetical protein